MYLAFDHPHPLISNFQPYLTRKSNKHTKLVLGTRTGVGRVRDEVARRRKKDGGMQAWWREHLIRKIGTGYSGKRKD